MHRLNFSAAVTTLAKFAAQCPELQNNIRVLLRRCLLDTDDEVRDRAAYYVAVLEQNDPKVNSQYILNSLQVSCLGLERLLQQYCAEPQEKPFDLNTVPIEVAQVERKPAAEMEIAPVTVKEEAVKATRTDIYAGNGVLHI